MWQKNYPIVLYWVSGGILTPAQEVDKALYGPGTRTRNADYDNKDGALEECDYVAGPDIPERYTDPASVHRKSMAIPYTEWVQRKHAMIQKGLKTPRDEVTHQVLVHGGPDGKGGTRDPVLTTMPGTPSNPSNRPANALGSALQTDGFGFLQPGQPGYVAPAAPETPAPASTEWEGATSAPFVPSSQPAGSVAAPVPASVPTPSPDAFK